MAFYNKAWLTLDEVCQKLGIDTHKLNELSKSGDLPIYEVWGDSPYNSEPQLKVKVNDLLSYQYEQHLKESFN